jgi:protein-tyrosine-phosphatase
VFPDDLREADLILTMERMQLRETCLMETGTLGKTFTLKEFVRRALVAGSRPRGEPLGKWLRTVENERQPSDLLGTSLEDDVEDPYLGPIEAYEQACRELDALTRSVVELIWPVSADELSGAQVPRTP